MHSKYQCLVAGVAEEGEFSVENVQDYCAARTFVKPRLRGEARIADCVHVLFYPASKALRLLHARGTAGVMSNVIVTPRNTKFCGAFYMGPRSQAAITIRAKGDF
jgi:hypothetical protein